MLMRRIIPCLDIKDGRVVKGIQFQNLRDAGCPQQLAAAYEAQGADELVILDVSATAEARRAALHTIELIRAAISIPLTVGGGVRSENDAAALLEAGADKVAVNTAAVLEPTLIARLAARFGAQCTILALDAAARISTTNTDESTWEVVTHSGKTRTGIDALAWAEQSQSLGAGELLLTSFDRDGTGAGYDTALIAAIAARTTIPIIASGGARTAEHLARALTAGADAVLAATIFHDHNCTVGDLKAQLARAGFGVRT